MRIRDNERSGETSTDADRRSDRTDLLHELGLGPLPPALDLEWFLDRFEEKGRT